MFGQVTTLALALAATGAKASAALGSYNVDPESVSVSGISSGGYMSLQLGVAYSDTFRTGFGVFAAGPYDCARNQSYLICFNDQDPDIETPIANMKAWSGSLINDVGNLKSRQIFLLGGELDVVAGPKEMDKLNAQMQQFADQSRLSYTTLPGQAHTFPTDFDSFGDNACEVAAPPFISNCQYDGAGQVLKWLYGELQPRNNDNLTGTVESFNQTGALGAPGMDSTGYVYVPKACQEGSATCKLHVALHGCLQSHSQIGSTFINNSGYTKWADSNNIIVLFPQTIPDPVPHVIMNGIPTPNQNACWDWPGWYGNDPDLIGGVQMTAIVNQVKQLISGSSQRYPRRLRYTRN